MLTHLDLFSGIGGFALAARWAGLTTTAFSEIEPYACQVLAKNFPGVPNLGDIRGIRNHRADVVTGGFPCQPFSVAGKRGGAGDDRHLWPEMRRVIAESGARWVVGENVPGIIRMELDNVLADLEALGYACRAFTVPACAVDARHRRDRVWIVAHHDGGGQQRARLGAAEERGAHADAGGQREAVADAHGAGPQGRQRGGLRERADQRAAGAGGASVEHAAGERRGKGRAEPALRRGRDAAGGAGASIPHAHGQPAGRSPEPRGEYCEWEPEPGVGRVAHGIPRRVDRLRGLGNAIVPQVAFRFLRWIAEIEAAEAERQRDRQPELF